MGGAITLFASPLLGYATGNSIKKVENHCDRGIGQKIETTGIYFITILYNI
jgi:hypothetical protein